MTNIEEHICTSETGCTERIDGSWDCSLAEKVSVFPCHLGDACRTDCPHYIKQDKSMTNIEKWEELFDKGFSFEGDNDPNTTPKMMFVNLHDGSKTLARPEYFKAFIRTLLQTERTRIAEEVEKLREKHENVTLDDGEVHVLTLPLEQRCFNDALDKVLSIIKQGK